MQTLNTYHQAAYGSDGNGPVNHWQHEIDQQIALRDLIRQIHRNLSIDAVNHTIVGNFVHFFQADWVLLLEKGPLRWQLLTFPGHLTTYDHRTYLTNYLGSDAVSARLRQAQPIVVNDQCWPTGDEHPWPKQLLGSWLLLPIHLPQKPSPSQEPWGLIAIGHTNPAQRWTAQQQDHARLLTDEIAVAIEHSQLYTALRADNQQLKSLALTDSLTSLANRRQFDMYFTAEWQRLAREQQPLTLILCDIDYFKAYNDYYGHPTGDVCLTQVSRVLSRCIRRPADLIARYGGEEFTVVLPNTDTSGGHRVAITVREQLAQAAIPHATSDISESITLTMGIATIIPRHDSSPHDLLQAADLALYHAKQQGRDRIYIHAHYCITSEDIEIESGQNFYKFDTPHSEES